MRQPLLLVSLYPIALLVLSAVHALWPQRDGPLALSQIFAPHLFLPLVLLLPLALVRGARLLRLALSAAAIVALVRFGPGVLSLPVAETPGATRIAVATWNVEAGQGRVEALADAVPQPDGSPAGALVGLQELSPDQADAILADPALQERFPYRILEPHGNVLGMGLLSSYPILDQGSSFAPAHIWALLDLGAGRTLRVVNGHPMPATISTARGLPYDYDPVVRDQSIAFLRGLAEPALQRGEPVLMLGDYNVTDREPAYVELTTGLADAHREVGLGPGSTWRPEALERLPFGVLRIDYLLASPELRPLNVSSDCTPRGSDHCLVNALLELP